MATLAEALKSIGKLVRIPSKYGKAKQKNPKGESVPVASDSTQPPENQDRPEQRPVDGPEEAAGSPLKRGRKRKNIQNEEEESEHVDLGSPKVDEIVASGSGLKYGAAKLCEQLPGLPTDADWKVYNEAGN